MTISGNPPAALIISGDEQNPVVGVLVNNSATNILYIGNDSSVSPTDPLNNSPVPPGQYVSFDGTVSIYGIAAAGQTVPVSVLLGVTAPPTSPNVVITGTPTVDISGNVPVTVTGTPTVDIGNSPAVTISGTPTVSITNTPTVDIGNTPSVTISGTPTVDVGTVTGSIDIASVAGNVDVLGVGGYISSGQYNQLVNDTATHAIGAASNYTTPVQNLTSYVSYALAVEAYNTGMGTAGSPLTARVVLNFYADSGATLLLYRETYWMWLASSAANAATIPLKLSGPAYGGYMTVEIDNVTNTGTINACSIQLYGTGRPLARPTAHQATPLGAGISSSGITLMPAVDWTSLGGAPSLLQGDDNIMALETNDTVFPISTTYWLPFPLHCGKVSVNYAVGAALAHAFVLCSAANLLSGGIVAGTSSQGMLWSVGTAVLSAQINDLAVGNAPLYAVISSSTTLPNPSLSITGKLA